jgi:hypothetical protein
MILIILSCDICSCNSLATLDLCLQCINIETVIAQSV